MTGAEKGFLLLSSCLGDPERVPLTAAQLRTLAQRVRQREQSYTGGDLTLQHLMALGFGREMSSRILLLLNQEPLLKRYLDRAQQMDCIPVSRPDIRFPQKLRRRLGLDCPGVLWTKGDLSFLEKPMIALVGSRDILPDNQSFAREVGRQAALQGYILVSGNARGADRAAQNACLDADGQVISVIADDLSGVQPRRNVLYISLEDFDAPFSAQRALSRNRVIHAMAEKTFVAQCSAGKGGTWDGSLKNLKGNWSPLFCFDDGSEGIRQLICMGAEPVTAELLDNLPKLRSKFVSFLDQ